MARPPCFIANWKMNKGIQEAESYVADLVARYKAAPFPSPREVILAPPFTALQAVSKAIKQSGIDIGLAAQNVHYDISGAYTGEISSGMLCEIGCKYVIIGHSERRTLFGETDDLVRRKVFAVRKAGVLPVLCIGETLKDRRTGKTWDRLQGQLSAVLTDDLIKTGLTDNILDWVIAYEPVWAIGTGETPTPKEVTDVHQQIRTFIADQVGKGTPRTLYGGSVSEKNIAEFLKASAIDGVLVGGASLSHETFFKLIELGEKEENPAL